MSLKIKSLDHYCVDQSLASAYLSQKVLAIVIQLL